MFTGIEGRKTFYRKELRNKISIIIDFARVGEARRFPAEDFADIILDLLE